MKHEDVIKSIYILTAGSSLTKSMVYDAVHILALKHQTTWKMKDDHIDDYTTTMTNRIRNLMHDFEATRSKATKWLPLSRYVRVPVCFMYDCSYQIRLSVPIP